MHEQESLLLELPSNVALAEVLVAGGLFYHLTVHIQWMLVGVKDVVETSKVELKQMYILLRCMLLQSHAVFE